MSLYDNDPRVNTDPDDSFTVSVEGRWKHVCPGQRGGFVTHSVGVDKVDGPGFDTADEAIRSLIGDPR